MSLHYNAFISYKHAELDNKVAAAIEWDLEHYHIPKKIQKKTGYKKIERIFRDKRRHFLIRISLLFCVLQTHIYPPGLRERLSSFYKIILRKMCLLS